MSSHTHDSAQDSLLQDKLSAESWEQEIVPQLPKE
jgi:hypothetical protein